MAPIGVRSTAAATAPGLSIGAAVGIAVGGSFCLGVLLVSLTLVILRSKHRRALAQLEQQSVTRRLEVLENDHTTVNYPPIPSRQSFHITRSNSTAWRALSSNEDLPKESRSHNSRRFSAKRKSKRQKESDKLSWPLPRNPQFEEHQGQLKKLKSLHLSAIMESPRSQVKTPEPNNHSVVETHESVDSNVMVPPLSSQPLYPAEYAGFQCHPRARSMDAEQLQSSTINRNRASFKRPSSYATSRSVSVPSLLGRAPGTSVLSAVPGSRPSSFQNRSISLGQLPGAAPTAPLPSLPSNLALTRQTTCISDLSPRSSVSSRNSASSAILKIGVGHSMNAVRDFSTRHPEMGLGGKIRDGVSEEVKKSLLSKGSDSHDQATVTSQKKTPSQHGLIRDVITRSIAQSNPAKRRQPDDADEDDATGDGVMNDTTVRLSVASSINLNRVSSCASLGSTPVRIVETPRRHSQTLNVSANGSPLERRRSASSLIPDRKSIPFLRVPDKDAIGESPDEIAGNPFEWDASSSPNSPKTSTLKSNSNVKKTHKRQNCVRISISPSILGPPSRSSSSLALAEITEECTKADSATESSRRSQQSRRPPSSDTFAPELNMKPDRMPSHLSSASQIIAVTDFAHSAEQPSNESQPLDHVSASSLLGSGIPRFPSPGHSNHACVINHSRQDDTQEASTIEPELASLHRPEIISSSQYMYRLLPSQKTSPTTELSQSMVSATAKPRTPLSTSSNLFENAPKFPPPSSAGPPRFSRPTPRGPRSPSPPDLVNSVKALRRMNSDVLYQSKTGRHYLQLGQRDSIYLNEPHSRNSTNSITSKMNLSSIMLLDSEFGGKENRDSMRYSTNWEDGGGIALQSLSENRRSMSPSPTSSKGVGEPATQRMSVKSNASGSLYDVDGFLRL